MRARSACVVSICLLVLALVPAFAQNVSQAYLEEQVGHELRMLPWYNVFDNLEYRVEGNTVYLSGQVTRPVTRQDAEGAVRSIRGVENVVNNIEVLPLSPIDDQIRRQEYRAIFSSPGFEKYSIQAVPPIHIVVDNGNVTLEGVVGSQMDKDLAGIRANQVPGVFSVTNNLRVQAE